MTWLGFELRKHAAELTRGGASFVIAHNSGAWLRVVTMPMDATAKATGCLVSVSRATRQTGIICIAVGDGVSEATVLAVLAHELGHWLLAACGRERVRSSFRRLANGNSSKENADAAEDELDAWRIAKDLFDWSRIDNGAAVFDEQFTRSTATYVAGPFSLSGREAVAAAAAALFPLRIC